MLVIDLGLALMSLSIIRKNNMKVDVIWGEGGILYNLCDIAFQKGEMKGLKTFFRSILLFYYSGISLNTP